MANVKAWRLLAHRTEMQRLAAKIQGLTSTAECYRLVRDCYRVLAKHDEAKKRKKAYPNEEKYVYIGEVLFNRKEG